MVERGLGVQRNKHPDFLFPSRLHLLLRAPHWPNLIRSQRTREIVESEVVGLPGHKARWGKVEHAPGWMDGQRIINLINSPAVNCRSHSRSHDACSVNVSYYY